MAKINLPIWYLKEKYWELKGIRRSMSMDTFSDETWGLYKGREESLEQLLKDAGYDSNIDDIKDL